MTVAPLVLIVGLEEILIIQVMMPRKMDRRIFMNSVCGAVVGLTLNLLLVRSLKAEGSAIVWLCSEAAVFLSAAFAVFGKGGHDFPIRRLVDDLLYYVPLPVMLWLLQQLPVPYALLRLALCGLVTGAYFFVVSCYIVKDSVILGVLNSFLKRKAA